MRTVSVAAPAAPPTTGESFSLKYQVKVITPLFGGSVMPRKTDAAAPIRVPSIRGHLRWWYRATVGRGYHSVTDLRAAETSIFGDTASASAVDVRVTIKQPGRPLKEDEVPLRQGDKLFPIFPSDRGSVLGGVEFELVLRLEKPEHKPILETVLWAWSNFGGIGAKTRRGCGALWIAEFAPALDASRKLHLQGWSKRIAGTSGQSNWPHLGVRPLIMPAAGEQNVWRAWRDCIEAYREFRQQGPDSHGIASFDLLGYAKQDKRRMSSPIVLRPAVWGEGRFGTPMVVPLQTGVPEQDVAVRKVLEYLWKVKGFRPAGEY